MQAFLILIFICRTTNCDPQAFCRKTHAKYRSYSWHHCWPLGYANRFFGYGYTQFINWFGEIPDVAEQVDHVARTQFVSLIGPILALVDGGMAHARPLWSGPVLLVSGVLMYRGFEFGAFTMFPITMSLVAGTLALIAHFTKGD